MTLPIRAIRSLTVAALCAGFAGCEDPGRAAGDVIAARGDCSQDSLRVSSEACVDMFQRYADMATEVIQTYIGGIKAMDEAVRRMPPPDFDTVGVGRAIRSEPPEMDERWSPRGSPVPQGALGGFTPPLDAGYDWDSPGDRGPRPPAGQPGVLLRPEERLDRPWLREELYRDERDPRSWPVDPYSPPYPGDEPFPRTGESPYGP